MMREPDMLSEPWKRLVRDSLAGAAIGTAWGIASGFIPRWTYLGITAAVLVAVIGWALRTLRELRAQKRELDEMLAGRLLISAEPLTEADIQSARRLLNEHPEYRAGASPEIPRPPDRP